jgi:hypothetical protein
VRKEGRKERKKYPITTPTSVHSLVRAAGAAPAVARSVVACSKELMFTVTEHEESAESRQLQQEVTKQLANFNNTPSGRPRENVNAKRVKAR